MNWKLLSIFKVSTVNGSMIHFEYDGKLDIRPRYQREFVYDDEKREAVINSLVNDFPLNTIYWAVKEDGNYEVIDGQQRIISICQYIAGDFSVNGRYFHSLQDDEKKIAPQFPFICLTVSGGHTQLVKVNSYYDMQIIGTTLDDAAGEAFDKCAKILGLSYPGGYIIDQYAKKGNNKAFQFSKPKVQGLDFSFSGFKTSVLYFINKQISLDKNFIHKNIYDLCASIQYTIVEILLHKIEKSIKETGIRNIAIAGGVSANSYLRERLSKLESQKKYNVSIPKLEYCTDNAAMIAIAGYFKYLDKGFAKQSETSSARLLF